MPTIPSLGRQPNAMHSMVSVVVPTYNRPQGLKTALESILKQTYGNLEVLVVNDSEEEESVKNVIAGFNDPRLYYLRNKRTKGANGARNTGILNSHGSLIAFMDDDDEWLPDKLQNQVDYLSDHTNHVGLFSAFEIYESGKWQVKKQKISSLSLRDCLLNTISIGSSSSLLFRREIFDTAGLWDESLVRQQDKELLVRILVHGTIGHDQRVLLRVNGHNDPHPLKSIPGHEVYYQKVSPYLELLDNDSQRKFHSFHFRRLCMYYLKMGDYKTALELYNKALKYQKVHLRKDVKNFIYLLKSIVSTKPSVTN